MLLLYTIGLNKYIVAFWILFFSVKLLLKSKENPYMMLLFGIITYINISLVFSDILEVVSPLSANTLSWQRSIRDSNQWLLGACCLSIMLGVFNVFVDSSFARESRNYSEIEMKDNPIIFYVGMIGAFFILVFFSYASSTTGSYESNTNPLYEYCLVIIPILWLYSGNKIIRKILLTVFIAIYVIKAILHGDRSSMIPMALFLYFMYFGDRKISGVKIVFFALGGILFSNLISVYRISSSWNGVIQNFLSRYGGTLFTSDTVSMSYYTSVVVEITHNEVATPWKYFFDFVLGLFLGGGFRNADVNTFVLNYHFHRYGGFFYSWFYFWFGITGVILGAVMVGIILKKAFTRKGNYFEMLKLMIIIFSFRWYLYSPLVFFRSILIVFSVVYGICYWFDNVSSKYIS